MGDKGGESAPVNTRNTDTPATTLTCSTFIRLGLESECSLTFVSIGGGRLELVDEDAVSVIMTNQFVSLVALVSPEVKFVLFGVPILSSVNLKMDLTNFFLAVSSETQDKYWKTLFYNISQGRCPPFFSIRDGYFLYRYARKFKEVQIPADVKSAFNVLSDFMRTNGGICSPADSLKRSNYKPPTWARIRNNKALFHSYVFAYCRTTCDILKLTDKDVGVLYMILTGRMKSDSKLRVEVDAHKITRIPALAYCPVSKRFWFTEPESAPTYKPPASKKSKPCNSKWNALVEDMIDYCSELASLNTTTSPPGEN